MAEATRPSRIDMHHHFFAPEYLAVMGDMAKRPVVRDWTVARSLEEMDKNGIGTSALSLSPPGLHHVATEETRRLARAVNEHAAKMRSSSMPSPTNQRNNRSWSIRSTSCRSERIE